jgi:two-component system OmpR family sensor kinase
VAETIRKVSLVTRVARTATLAAAVSALSAAAATSVIGAMLLQNAADLRLIEAARDLEYLLGDSPLDRESIQTVVGREHDETEHAGIRFTISDPSGAFIAGDAAVLAVSPDECSTRSRDRLRICSVATSNGVIVTAAALNTRRSLLFIVAASIALVFSGLVTWFWSLPMARSALAPFARLQSKVAAIDVDAGAKSDLGAAEHVIEVDALRASVELLLERVGAAIDQSQRFAANAAHELRTPLSAVRAELDLLREHPALPDVVAAQLATARAKVTDLVVLVDRLLALTTPKRSADAPGEIVSLRDVMEDVVRGLPPEQIPNVALPEADALVKGDALLLGSLFANALVNALKFGHRVQVNLSVVDGVASIVIDDDGPGLDEADWERVFEPFYRDGGAIRGRKPGHGLGLALVRHIAQIHGGNAAFRPRHGTGARLEVRLPELNASR